MQLAGPWRKNSRLVFIFILKYIESVFPLCDDCEFAKHHWVNFSPSSNENIDPLSVIQFTLMIRALPLFLIFLTGHGLSHLLMIILELFIQFYRMVKHNLGKILNICALTRERSMLTNTSQNSEFMRFHVLILLNKMRLLRGRIITLLELLELHYSKWKSRVILGGRGLNNRVKMWGLFW